ncbi:DUF308 domain-containing protein [Streptomyces sp. PT12]|uniref:YqeB family protein n=1 Tax=Streptomyces sp. PT12 TaxID=1510197 RepID=UPI000DE36CA6|nr:DUF308 domain-containing protein [Streptomyces sp. PT12]RBM20662.1 hypothetical protein DEH69_06710 [Streptomyces sp. PT12]
MRSSETTELGLSLGDRLLIIVGAPVLATPLGFALPSITDWADDRPWLPLPGPLAAIAELEGRWVALALGGAGLVLGLLGGLLLVHQCLRVTLSDKDIRVDKGDRSRRIPRADVGAAFVDGKRLVILDPETRELIREEFEGKRSTLAEGFRAHGYPWHQDGDPHADLYRRWVPDTPDIPPAANALLKARESALKKKHKDDITELHTEIQKLGIVIRDEPPKQYWRPLVPH